MTYYEMREDAAFLLNMGSQCPLWVISWTYRQVRAMSALPPEADMLIVSINVC